MSKKPMKPKANKKLKIAIYKCWNCGKEIAGKQDEDQCPICGCRLVEK